MSELETQCLISALGAESMRFVGGCVRNHLLGFPINDIDIATVLAPDTVMQTLQGQGIQVIPTGLKHGTVTAVIRGRHFEITTLRRDVECHGRHADVEYTECWKEDAARRDFTINALYADAEGNVYDYFDGLEDIKRGLVRFIGDPVMRIKEDALRILRFFRFYARYGSMKALDGDIAAIAAHKELLRGLSGERIQTEMFKLCSNEDVFTVFGQMHALGILDEIQMEVARLTIPTGIVSLTPVVFLACVLYKNSASKLIERWKLSNKDKKLLLFLEEHSIPENAETLVLKKIMRRWGKDWFADLAFVSFSRGEINYLEYTDAMQLYDTWDIPDFPIRAADLLEQGFVEGKKLGKTLKTLEAQWEESEYVLSKEALLEKLSE